MVKIKVLLDSVEKVKKFTSIVAKEDVECELVEGIHIVDAKSIMGIFSMNLKDSLELIIHSDSTDLPAKLQEFLVVDATE